MLSVRSLAKIASRKKNGKEDGVGSSSSSAASPLIGKAGGGLGGSDVLLGNPRSCPAPLGARRATRGRLVLLVDEAAAPAPDSDQNEEQPAAGAFRWPSISEMISSCAESIEESQRQGAGEFLTAAVVLVGAVYTLSYMIHFLQATLHLQVPQASRIIDRFWVFYAAHPILCLSLNFGIAVLIGAAFLFLERIQRFVRDSNERIVRFCRYGYEELDDEEQTNLFATMAFSKRSGLHAGMNYLDAFGALDKDGGGSIDAAELEALMVSLGQQPTQEELDKMVKLADLDGSGDIDFVEVRPLSSAS